MQFPISDGRSKKMGSGYKMNVLSAVCYCLKMGIDTKVILPSDQHSHDC